MDDSEQEFSEKDLPAGFSAVRPSQPDEDMTEEDEVVEDDPLAEEGEEGSASLLIGEDLTPEEEAYFLGSDGTDY